MYEVYDHEQIEVHEQTEVLYPGYHEFIKVDVGIAPLLQALWNLGIRTCNSCEENEPGIIWIEFYSIEDLEKFLKMIIHSLGDQINSNPEAQDWLCYRVLGYGGDSLGPWRYDAHPNVIPIRSNQKRIYSKNASSCKVELSVSLRFPQEDFEMILGLMKECLSKNNTDLKEIDDNQWNNVKRYLPPQPLRGRRADERKIINGILYVLKTGCGWREFPPRYGSYVTAQRRLKQWSNDGVLDKIFSSIEDSESYKDRLSYYLSKSDDDSSSSRTVNLPYAAAELKGSTKS
jgi:Putative transposase of IS4/5 family (DUF4096)